MSLQPGHRGTRSTSPPRSSGLRARTVAYSRRSLPSIVASVQPPEPVYYLTPADLVRCHAAALGIAKSTARHHMLHRDGLLSALDRPRWHAHYRKSDLIDQAAVLAEGLVASHAWVDGNKRTTWVALRTFLDVNSLRWLQPRDVDEVVGQMTGLTTRRIKSPEFANWLRPQLQLAGADR